MESNLATIGFVYIVLRVQERRIMAMISYHVSDKYDACGLM